MHTPRILAMARSGMRNDPEIQCEKSRSREKHGHWRIDTGCPCVAREKRKNGGAEWQQQL